MGRTLGERTRNADVSPFLHRTSTEACERTQSRLGVAVSVSSHAQLEPAPDLLSHRITRPDASPTAVRHAALQEVVMKDYACIRGNFAS